MTDARPTEHDPDDASPPALWAVARHLLGWLTAVFGDACAVAALGVVSPAERDEILTWLRPIEALARRLLVVEAAALERSPMARRRAPAAMSSADKAPRVRLPHRCDGLDPADPRGWRVAFRVCAAPEGMRGSSDAGPRRETERETNTGTGIGLAGAWPLAERIEAVTRVLEDPAPFAARLARRLTGRADRVAGLVAPPPQPRPAAPGRRRKPGVWRKPPLGAEALDHARAHAAAALAVFDTG